MSDQGVQEKVRRLLLDLLGSLLVVGHGVDWDSKKKLEEKAPLNCFGIEEQAERVSPYARLWKFQLLENSSNSCFRFAELRFWT